MTNMKQLRLSKRITDWFFTVDPYNGCPYTDAWKGTHEMLTDRPEEIVQSMAEYLDEDLPAWMEDQAAALIKAIAAWEAGVPLPTDR